MQYSVFVAEDEAIIREGIRNHLENSPRYTLCGEAADGEMALSAILELKPDMLVTDIRMPFMDGLALGRAVKRASPRTKILIVTGHDEFEYAQQAISIGIDEYLLKPLLARTLLDMLDKLADRLEEERAARVNMSKGRILGRQEQLQLRDGFFDELLTGALTTAQALEMAERFHIDLPARMYLAAEMELRYTNALPQAALQVHAAMDELLKAREDALWCLRGRDRAVLIAKGESAQALEYTMYEIAIAARDELQASLGVETATCIGAIRERISGIAESYAHARDLMRRLPTLPGGIIADCGDLEKGGAMYAGACLDEPVSRQLRYATEQDIPRILEQVFGAIEEQGISSLLYSYYRIMDLLMVAARIVNEAGGNAQELFPELGNPNSLLQIAGDTQALTGFARGILTRLIACRTEGALHNQRYGDILAKAKQYIYENYGDSGLSLQTVAAYSSFSANHFSTIFSQNTGETFIAYLTRVRMEQAKKLLQETTLSSAEVAYRTGYNDTNYFRYLFKKHFGKSPRDYRSTPAGAKTM